VRPASPDTPVVSRSPVMSRSPHPPVVSRSPDRDTRHRALFRKNRAPRFAIAPAARGPKIPSHFGPASHGIPMPDNPHGHTFPPVFPTSPTTISNFRFPISDFQSPISNLQSPISNLRAYKKWPNFPTHRSPTLNPRFPAHPRGAGKPRAHPQRVPGPILVSPHSPATYPAGCGETPSAHAVPNPRFPAQPRDGTQPGCGETPCTTAVPTPNPKPPIPNPPITNPQSPIPNPQPPPPIFPQKKVDSQPRLR
jgi:hypothetical protein